MNKNKIISLLLVMSLVFSGISYAALPISADETDGESPGESTESTDSENQDSSTESGTDSSTDSSIDSESSIDAAEISVPAPSDSFYVLDEANVLSDETESNIVAKSTELNSNYGAQIVVVTVNNITGKMKDYCYKLFNEWKIGSDKQNGLLFLLDIGDDTYYAMAGSGLMDQFTSDALSEMLKTYLEPSFNTKDYSDGVDTVYAQALSEVSSYMSKLSAGTSDSTASSGSSTGSGIGGVLKGIGIFILILVLIIVIGFIVIYLRGQALRKKRKQRRSSSAARQRPRTQSNSQSEDDGRQELHTYSDDRYSEAIDPEDYTTPDDRSMSDSRDPYGSSSYTSSTSSKYDFDAFSSRTSRPRSDGDRHSSRRR